jgi:hypothetical protein
MYSRKNRKIFLFLTAFLGYVLPYGQMSLWGATVITNLLSAIPWLGKSLVEFVWGGLCRLGTVEEHSIYDYINIYILKILLIAGISYKFIYFTEYLFFFSFTKDYKYVKKSIKLRESAELLKQKELIIFNNFQRLESGDFIYPYLVGLIEGDGWFSISKKGNYLTYEFGIELSIRDVQLIYKIKKLLGVGSVFFRERKENKNTDIQDDLLYNENNLNNRKPGKNMVIYRIRNKSHLKNIIIPIFDKYPLLTNKLYDYMRFKTSLLSDVKYSKDLIKYNRPILSNNSVSLLLNTPYFSAWLIGFIEAESCFSIYKPKDSNSYVASFEIAQTNEEIILLAIRKFLKLVPNVRVDKTNNFRLKVSSVRAIENVIKFMNQAPLKLLGYKKLQYVIWLKKLRKIPRYYNKINIPYKY